MRLIRKKEIKFVKLFLISPILEQILNILYLFSLPVLVIKFLHTPTNLNPYDTNQITKQTFLEENFRNISNKEELISYLDTLMSTLYAYKPSPNFIPISSVQLKKYSLFNNCSLTYVPCYNNSFSNGKKLFIKNQIVLTV